MATKKKTKKAAKNRAAQPLHNHLVLSALLTLQNEVREMRKELISIEDTLERWEREGERIEAMSTEECPRCGETSPAHKQGCRGALEENPFKRPWEAPMTGDET